MRRAVVVFALATTFAAVAACADRPPWVYPALPLPGETAFDPATYPSIWIGNFVDRPVQVIDGRETVIVPILSLVRTADGAAVPGITKHLDAFVYFVPDTKLAPDTDYTLQVDLRGDTWEWDEPVYAFAARVADGHVFIPFSTRSHATVLRAHWSGGRGEPTFPYGIYVMFSQAMDRNTTAGAMIIVDGVSTYVRGSYEDRRSEYNYFSRQHILYLEVPFELDRGAARLQVLGAAADGTPLQGTTLIDPED